MAANGGLCRQVSWCFIREVERDETSSPEIESSSKVKLVSSYGEETVVIGKEVKVLGDCDTGETAELEWSNRWLPSRVMTFWRVVFVPAGLLRRGVNG